VRTGEGRYRRAEGLIWREFAGEVIVATREGDDFEVLASTGSLIWELLERPCSVDELVDPLAVVFGTSGSSIRGDVVAYVDELEERGVIERLPAP
jgi:hypothetical protein